MTAPIVRAKRPRKQDKTELGEWPRGRETHEITLHSSDRPGIAQLRRHRVAADPPYDVVATVEHAGGVVSRIEWDEWHVQSRPEWMPNVEDWIRATIAEYWAKS